MEISQTYTSIENRSGGFTNFLYGLQKVFQKEPKLAIQIFLTLPLIAAGIVFEITVLQWIFVILSTLFTHIAEICRTAASLQIRNDQSLSSFEISRIRCIGLAGVVFTACISLIIYAVVFIPKIIQIF